MTPKQIVESLLRRFGYSATRFPPPHLISRLVKDFIRQNQINLVLDVGAYRGSFCTMLREDAGYSGLIASFEPCAESFRVLNAQMAGDSNWRGYSFGLSDQDSTAVLNTFAERGDFNSLLHLRDEGARAYNVDAGRQSTESIQLRKIDTIWDSITPGISSPRVFLKIDTQGHDPLVIQGATRHLQFIYGIQSELPTVEIYDGMTSMPEMLQLYRKLGFAPIGFFPVNTPKDSGLVPEFDVIFRQIPCKPHPRPSS